MIGKLGVGEETSSSSCCKLPTTICSSASGPGDSLLGVRRGKRLHHTAAMKAYLCGITTAKQRLVGGRGPHISETANFIRVQCRKIDCNKKKWTTETALFLRCHHRSFPKAGRQADSEYRPRS